MTFTVNSWYNMDQANFTSQGEPHPGVISLIVVSFVNHNYLPQTVLTKTCGYIARLWVVGDVKK